MQNNSKKIIIIGMPDMMNVCLAKLVEAGFNIVGFIPPPQDNPTFNSAVAHAGSLKVPIYPYEESPNEPEFVEKIASLEADIGIITSFDKKLSREFLATTREGYINCHPSLLPKYRGANPYFHIIARGETKTGVTLHFADENFDTGDVIMQKEILIEKNETTGTLFNRSNYVIADCLIETLQHYEATGKFIRVKQPQGQFIRAPRIPSNLVLNLAQDIEEIERIIRASNPFYNATLFFRGIMLRIISAQIRKETHGHLYGQIIKTGGNIEIAMNGGFLTPKIVQVGTWGVFDTKEFVEKFNPQSGERLMGGG